MNRSSSQVTKRQMQLPASTNYCFETIEVVRELVGRMNQRNADLNIGLIGFLDEKAAEIDRLEAQLGGLVKPIPPHY